MSALVTGAGSGIGRAAARALRARGMPVILVGRSAGPLQETLPPAADVCHVLSDVADAPTLAEGLEAATGTCGPVGTAILAAGLNIDSHFLDASAEDFDAIVAANLTGVANCLRLVLPGMLRARHGRVVVIGTLADANPLPGAVAYAASKGALHPLVRGIAGEIGTTHYPDVLINELTPGPVTGRMSGEGRPPEAVVPEILALVDLPEGGATGGFFRYGKRLYPGESWKASLKRQLRRVF